MPTTIACFQCGALVVVDLHRNDETFLEEVEEESPDVATIVDAPIERDEKT